MFSLFRYRQPTSQMSSVLNEFIAAPHHVPPSVTYVPSSNTHMSTTYPVYRYQQKVEVYSNMQAMNTSNVPSKWNNIATNHKRHLLKPFFVYLKPYLKHATF